MLESEFKKKFCARVKRAVKPITILQYKQDATTVTGFPDTIVILEGITIFIEFKKSKTAKFRPGQKEWIQKLNDNGHFAFVCYPENADDILEEIKRIA
jgi:hypothetical protein